MDTRPDNDSDSSAKPREYSSLPIVTTATGAVLLSAAAGWYLLDREAPEWIDAGDSVPLVAMAIEDAVEDAPAIDIDLELRKARLAGDADFLVNPPEQNALYYYGRVLEADPGNAAAIAELDSVLARLSLRVTNHLATGDFGDAYDLVRLASARNEGHAVVDAMNRSLDDFVERLTAAAIRQAETGNDDEAAAVLARLGSLTGVGADYLRSAEESVTAIQQSRDAAERERIEQERLAAEQKIADWTEKVRGAMDSGRLISPPGDSARDYLPDADAPESLRQQLTGELHAALIDSVERSLQLGDLSIAESYLDAAVDLGDDGARVAELRTELEKALIVAEENRVLGLSDFVRLNTVPAKYPRLANQYNITGWVDVLFTVTPTGATADIEVVEAEPENVFEESAIEAVEKWTFQPREYRGQLISQRTAARLVFRLE